MKPGRSTRRRVLFGAGTLVGLAGCADLNEEEATPTRSSDTRNTTTETTATQNRTETDNETETETDNETEDDGPGYKDYHWHGRLFFEINGELVDFAQPKYYLKNIEEERPETVYFHFHDSAHGPNEWSNEKEIVTFERALNLLPGIGYERARDNHVVTYEGTTFDASRSGTSVSIHRGTERIDPTTYEVRHDDNFWVHIRTDAESNSSPDATTGKLIVDVNNRRLDFGAETYLQAGSDRFEFRDDGKPFTWYNAGDSVTLAHVFDSIPTLEYELDGAGEHVLTYESDDELGGTYHDAHDATQLVIRRRTTPIDPTTYRLEDGDIIWVYIHTSNAPDNEH